MDILIVIPAILEDHDVLGHSNSSTQSRLCGLLNRVKIQLTLLYKWRWRWQISSAHDVSALPPFTVQKQLCQLHFSRAVLASELMLYNTTLIWLLVLLFKLDYSDATGNIEECAIAATPEDESLAKPTSFYPLRRPGSVATLRDPAFEICRSFEWVSKHYSHNKEPTYLYLFPVGMAMAVLEKDHEGMALAKSLLHESTNTANYVSGASQAGFGFYLSQEASAKPGAVQVQGSLFLKRSIELFSAIRI
jgi:hypothetical protein